MLEAAKRPWSEMSTPWFVSRSVRFISQDVAVVDGANTQYGSLILARGIPVLLVLKKESSHWRIATLRAMSGCGPLWLP